MKSGRNLVDAFTSNILSGWLTVREDGWHNETVLYCYDVEKST